MAVTRLKRKELRNRTKATKRREKLKSLTHLPPIKKVDVDQIKEEFAQKSGKKSSAKKEDTTAVEKEPAKVKADVKKEDTAVEKEPAKTQVKDTPVAEKAKKEDSSSEEKE